MVFFSVSFTFVCLFSLIHRLCTEYREFWEVILLLNICSIACLGLAFFVLLFVLFLGRRGFQKACSTASLSLVLIFSVLGFAASGVTAVYYAAEHGHSVPMCLVEITQELPFCNHFWARDDLGNAGHPLYGWYITGAAAVLSLIGIILTICSRPRRYLNYRRLN